MVGALSINLPLANNMAFKLKLIMCKLMFVCVCVFVCREKNKLSNKLVIGTEVNCLFLPIGVLLAHQEKERDR